MISRVIVGPFLALIVPLLLSPPLHAQSAKSLKPVKRNPVAPVVDPFVTAQVQIARLRQTADQLRLLAQQPLPPNLGSDARVELAQHEQWLREAEQRVSVLANQWEERLKPLNGANATRLAADLNAFFEAQSAHLQSKLRRESLTRSPITERVRSSGDTARLVIGKMY